MESSSREPLPISGGHRTRAAAFGATLLAVGLVLGARRDPFALVLVAAGAHATASAWQVRTKLHDERVARQPFVLSRRGQVMLAAIGVLFVYVELASR